jgi:endogenous inhibitor of DNA gyrase (YacG/DUF329 family)
MPARIKGCPICGKPSTAESRPFCSERCRDVDLNRWLSGTYVVRASDDADEDDSGPLPPRDDDRD